jgi:hypothetical protein
MAADPREYQRKIDELRQRAQRNNGSDRQIHNRIDSLRDKKFTTKNKPGKVNQDPRPPNEPKPNGGNPSNVSQPNYPTPAAPGSREQQGFSAYNPPSNMPDPRDEQYWRDMSRLMFDKNAQISSLNTEQTYADTGYTRQMADLQNREYWDSLAQKQASNRAGAFYSTASEEDAGRLRYGYAQQRLQAGGQYSTDSQTRTLQKAALEQGYTLDEADALASAVDRQSQSEMDRPSPYNKDLMEVLQSVLSGGKKDESNKQIQRLQDQLKKADNPKDRGRIRRRIKRLESKDNGKTQGQKGSQGRQGKKGRRKR